MSATFVVDGYNLLHGMGLVGTRIGPRGLERARERLLGLIAGALEQQAAMVTVVFDGRGPDGNLESRFKGVEVLFSSAGQEADDVIERLIRSHSAPKDLHVVSDDRRIRTTAGKRHCHVLSCEAFLAWLERARKQRLETDRQQPEKIEKLSDQETQAWLAEFRDLETDPSLKKAFESFDFEGPG